VPNLAIEKVQQIDQQPAEQQKSPSSKSMDSDEVADKGARKFLDVLRKIGPHSKQILNYSYPPLLYQRGEEEDEDDEEQDCDDED